MSSSHPEPTLDPIRPSGSGRAEPGERAQGPGARRLLDRAPSDRYRQGETSGSNEPGSPFGPADLRRRVITRAVIGATMVALIGAAILTMILGVLTSTAGTFAVSGLASIAIGVIVATTAVPIALPRGIGPAGTVPGGVVRGSAGLTAAPLRRDQATRLALGIAFGMIVLTGIGVWVLARTEGGVMDPFTYLWTTFGFGLPAQTLIAVIGSAWGAANGPIRWRG